MRYYLYIFLLALVMVITNCDTASIASSQLTPEISLAIIEEESDLDGKAEGDDVNLAFGLDFKNMNDIFYIEFDIVFEDDIFTFDSYDFEISPSFFYTSGDPINDYNENGVLDDDEDYSDQNGNGIYDPPQNYPEGFIISNQGLLEGQLGVMSPEIYGNVWGTERACKFYFSGTLNEATFEIRNISAKRFTDASVDPEILSTSGWDIYPLVVGSAYDTKLYLQQDELTSDQLVVSLQIGDTPKLAQLSAVIEYDPGVLSYSYSELLEFTSSINYNLGIIPGDNNIQYIIEHDVIDDLSSSEDISQGSGGIVKIVFNIISQSNTTVSIDADNVSALGHTSNEISDETYPYNIDYWEITESLEINF